MRCDACKHWTGEDAPGDRRRWNRVEVRECRRVHEMWDATEWAREGGETILRLKPERADDKMFVQDGSDYAAYLYTTADFFCAHHEPQ